MSQDDEYGMTPRPTSPRRRPRCYTGGIRWPTQPRHISLSADPKASFGSRRQSTGYPFITGWVTSNSCPIICLCTVDWSLTGSLWVDTDRARMRNEWTTRQAESWRKLYALILIRKSRRSQRCGTSSLLLDRHHTVRVAVLRAALLHYGLLRAPSPLRSIDSI